MMKKHPHPGQLIRTDVIEPSGLDITEAAARLGVSRLTLSRLLNGHHGVSPDMAARLEKAGAGTAQLWMQLQMNYELPQVAR
ncbi:HigA family addiction module antitoxin [Advenella sp. FME57]|uniref:HigA family addiction module antitoxin n=1 Tax=Advenella sp. FME57 TaxID=2742604 RepID=UPI001867C507|nr:HigA family addiction module antitoxin [Advenella sp. FME57]